MAVVRRYEELGAHRGDREALDQSVSAVKESLLFPARTGRVSLQRYLSSCRARTPARARLQTGKSKKGKIRKDKEGGPLARIRPLSTPHLLVV